MRTMVKSLLIVLQRLALAWRFIKEKSLSLPLYCNYSNSVVTILKGENSRFIDFKDKFIEAKKSMIILKMRKYIFPMFNSDVVFDNCNLSITCCSR